MRISPLTLIYVRIVSIYVFSILRLDAVCEFQNLFSLRFCVHVYMRSAAC